MKASKGSGKRIKDKKILAYIVVFFVGVSIMLYPTISNVWNDHVFKNMISKYDAEVDLKKSVIDKELKAARDYNEDLSPKIVPDAFAAKDGVRDKEYEKLLNISGNGMMGYIEIPAIDAVVPIYHYTTEKTLKKGAGHLPGSSLPVGGKGTHSVLSAHRGLPSAKLFTDLDLMEKGNAFYIHVLDKTLKYETDQILTVKPKETGALAITEEKDYVTLVTCTPYGINTHRLLVRGHRVPNDKKKDDVSGKTNYTRMLITLFCILSGMALAFVITKLMDTMRKKHESKGRKEIQ